MHVGEQSSPQQVRQGDAESLIERILLVRGGLTPAQAGVDADVLDELYAHVAAKALKQVLV